MKEQKKVSKKTRALLRLVIKILSIAAIVLILLNFVIGIEIVHTNDNFPSVKDGDLIVYLRLGDAYIGDLVSYKYNDETYIGRVVGMGGDEIDFTDVGYTLNGTVQYETIYYETHPTDAINYPYKVKDNQYFVLNDYREQCNDSREFGAIQKINGRIVLILRGRGF